MSKEYKGYFYHERALNPTNPQDLAEGWQVEIINNFIKNPNLEKQIGQRLILDRSEILYIAQPIRVDSPNCLKCHSTPDVAPAALIKSYGRERGFNWKLNEIIGARIICVPTSLQRQQAISKVAILVCLSAIVVDLLSFLLVNIWFRQTQGKQPSKLLKLVIGFFLYGICALIILRILGQDTTTFTITCTRSTDCQY